MYCVIRIVLLKCKSVNHIQHTLFMKALLLGTKNTFVHNKGQNSALCFIDEIVCFSEACNRVTEQHLFSNLLKHFRNSYLIVVMAKFCCQLHWFKKITSMKCWRWSNFRSTWINTIWNELIWPNECHPSISMTWYFCYFSLTLMQLRTKFGPKWSL